MVDTGSYPQATIADGTADVTGAIDVNTKVSLTGIIERDPQNIVARIGTSTNFNIYAPCTTVSKTNGGYVEYFRPVSDSSFISLIETPVPSGTYTQMTHPLQDYEISLA